MADWPKAGDSLFGTGPWSAEGILGTFTWPDGFYYYAVAYREAADELVQTVIDQRISPDSAIYPILYLYRHYVELILKQIIESGEMLEKKSDSGHEHHQLDRLWQQARYWNPHSRAAPRKIRTPSNGSFTRWQRSMLLERRLAIQGRREAIKHTVGL
jgi:hypothetical protein